MQAVARSLRGRLAWTSNSSAPCRGVLSTWKGSAKPAFGSMYTMSSSAAQGSEREVMPIRKVVVVGAGTLGSQVAFQTAVSGFDVTILDVSEGALSACRDAHARFARLFVAGSGASQARGWRGPEAMHSSAQAAADAALAHLSYTTDAGAACKDCDLISENVPEVPVIKGATYTNLQAHAPERAIFTTNSSTLLPSDFAHLTGRPERFLALHFANDIWNMNVGEVMPHAGTDPAVCQRVLEFAKEIHMVPIQIDKETNGYVMNSMIVPWINSAQWLVTSGVATAEDVDRTWMIINPGTKRGPMAVMDLIGLETVRTVMAHWGEVLKEETVGKQMQANAVWLEAKVKAGHVGIKNGNPLIDSAQGHYSYPDPAFMHDDFLS
mmetsp:Transcript_52179/g.151629  ORF Transcript_52179/g.151629 Transcript_52179/m.151629 type:complete len:380 (+) Transcript_52179:43-1182(+)